MRYTSLEILWCMIPSLAKSDRIWPTYSSSNSGKLLLKNRVPFWAAWIRDLMMFIILFSFAIRGLLLGNFCKNTDNSSNGQIVLQSLKIYLLAIRHLTDVAVPVNILRSKHPCVIEGHFQCVIVDPYRCQQVNDSIFSKRSAFRIGECQIVLSFLRWNMTDCRSCRRSSQTNCWICSFLRNCDCTPAHKPLFSKPNPQTPATMSSVSVSGIGCTTYISEN